MDNDGKLNRKLLEDLLTTIDKDILGGLLAPKDGVNLADLIQLPEIEASRITSEDVKKLLLFAVENLNSYEIKKNVSVRKDDFISRTVSELIEGTNIDLEFYKNAFDGIVEDLFKFFKPKFELKKLSQEKKKEYMILYNRVYHGGEPSEYKGPLTLTFKQEVIDSPAEYLRTDVNIDKIYEKHRERINDILNAYIISSAGSWEKEMGGKGAEGLAQDAALGGSGGSSPAVSAGNSSGSGGNPPLPINLGQPKWYTRFWHLNPLSTFGELYRKAKNNRKKLREGKIGPWSETFAVGDKSYDLEDPAKLKALPPTEKMYLGREYNKRKLKDWLVIGALIAGFAGEGYGAYSWIRDRFFIKDPTTPPIRDYLWPGSPKKESAKQAPCPSVDDVLREHGAFIPDENSCTASCSEYFPVQECQPIPECKPKTITKTNTVYKDKPCPPCNCQGRIK